MSVAIDHLDCRYAVRRGTGGEAMRARLDRIAATDFVNALKRPLDEPRPGQDDALCFIEHLEIEATIGVDTSEHDVANRWATSLWKAVAEHLRERDAAVRFASRADFLATFIVELLAGEAGTRWYFAELEAAAGNVPDRIVRVLLDDPDVGREALTEVHRRGCLHPLIDALDDAHLDELVTRCLVPPGGEAVFGAALQRWTAAVRALLVSGRFVPSGRATEDALVLYFETLATRPDLGPDVHLARWIVRLLRVAALAARTPALAETIREGGFEAARPLLESTEQARWVGSMLQAVSPREVTALLGDVQPNTLRLLHTAHAGVFLLARSVLALEEPLDPDDLFLALVETLGGTKAAREDAGVAAFAGSAATAIAALEARAADGAPMIAIAERLLADFAARLGAFADSSPEYLRKNFLRGHGLVHVTKDRIHVRFIDCPMRIVLRMTGLDAPVVLPWNGDRVLEVELE